MADRPNHLAPYADPTEFADPRDFLRQQVLAQEGVDLSEPWYVRTGQRLRRDWPQILSGALSTLGPRGGVAPRPAPANAQQSARSVPANALESYHGVQVPRTGDPIHPDYSATTLEAIRLLRTEGNFERAISSARSSETRNVLRSLQARGVDRDQAMAYWRGLMEMRNLERPARLNMLPPLGFAGLGYAADHDILGAPR